VEAIRRTKRWSLDRSYDSAGQTGSIVTVRKSELRFFVAEIRKEDLNILRDLMEAEKVTPVIDRTYKLSEAPAAIAYLETGRARGKVVLTPD
jgi:NADPH:quinone reductase-like Zn-dependent oxidoreductase